MILRAILITTILSTTFAIVRKRLAAFPKPAPNFHLQSWVTGQWYSLLRLPPCSYGGSKHHSNIEVLGKLHGNHVKQSLTWRDEDVCTTVMLRLDVLGGGKGHFIQVDPMGGMVTGDQIVVVYNPEKGYDINWGCTKKSVYEDCSDSWLLVKSRERFPERHVWECIARDLKRLFNVSLNEMIVVSHKNPC